MTKLYIGTGCSQAKEGALAGKRTVEAALRDFEADGGDVPEFGLLFCSGGKYRGDVEELVEVADTAFRSANDGIEWIGCTTAGEIFRGELRTGSCIALVLSSPHIDVSTGSADGVHDGPVEAGRDATRQALESLHNHPRENEEDTDRFLIALSPGLTRDAPGREDEVIEGIRDAAGEQVPVVGGTAGDDLATVETHQFANGVARPASVVVSAISSTLRAGFSFGNGFRRTEKRCRVTKSSGYRVEELDNRSALERYAELLEMEVHELWDIEKGDEKNGSPIPRALARQFSLQRYESFAANANTYPLGIEVSGGDTVVRSPSRVAGSSIEFTQKIPEDAVLNLLEYDRDESRKAEKEAIEEALEEAGQDPVLLFLADCALRKSYIGEESMERIFQELCDNYPASTIFGFHSMGEYTSRKGERPTANCHSVSVGCIGGGPVQLEDAGLSR